MREELPKAALPSGFDIMRFVRKLYLKKEGLQNETKRLYTGRVAGSDIDYCNASGGADACIK